MPPVELMEVQQRNQQLPQPHEENNGLHADPPSPPAPAEEYQKPVVGIIFPPPDVRNIVDKTASFVARNGPEFEARIRQNEITNSKFNFLNPADPYHAYYRQKVTDFAEGRAQESESLKVSAPSAARAPAEASSSTAQEVQKKLAEQFQPKEPPPEFEFSAEPASINAMELDIVKLSAQFVARNGRQFLTQLMSREQRNPQFDFLRPQHSLFSYFTKLVEQYTKVLIPPKDLLAKLGREAENSIEVLKQADYRVDWEKWQDKERRREQEAAERERMAYAQIDWHDFVIVETVDFQTHETGNFPPPTTPEEVGKRVLLEQRGIDISVPQPAVNPQQQNRKPDDVDLDRDEGSDAEIEEEEGEAPPPPAQPPSAADTGLAPPPPPAPPQAALVPPGPPKPGQAPVRRDYDPKAALAARQKEPTHFLVSPLTGERIPDSEAHKHVHIGLLDRQWIQQKEREASERAKSEAAYAPGIAVMDTLNELAERRTDIFGVGQEETFIGRKLQPAASASEDNAGASSKTSDSAAGAPASSSGDSSAVIWDGHNTSRELVAKRAAAAAAAASIPHQLPPPPPIGKPIGAAVGQQLHQPLQPPQLPPMPPRPIAAPLPPPPMPMPPHQRPQMMMMPPPMPPPPHQFAGMLMPTPMLVLPPNAAMLGAPASAALTAAMPPPPAGLASSAAAMSADAGGEPPAKRARTEAELMPEEAFLRAQPQGAAVIRVATPSDRPELAAPGASSIISLSLPLTASVASLKAAIADATNLPVAKQKLSIDGLFMKDVNSLAYYNITAQVPVSLQLKERGGRKK